MIESIRLQNFKNFKDATLKLGKLTVLVGTNASGKSNIRDAFRFLHGMGRGYSLAEIIGEKYVEGGVLQWKGIRGGIREVVYAGEEWFRITTELAHVKLLASRRQPSMLTHSIQVDLTSRNEGPRVAAESLHREGKMVFDSPVHSMRKQEASPHLLVRLTNHVEKRTRGKGIRFLDTKPVVSQFSDYFESRHNRFAALMCCETFASMRFLDLAPEAMKTPSIPGQVILGDRGENLSSVLQVICNDLAKKKAILEWIRQLTPLDVEDFDFVADQTGRILVTLIESGDRRTSAYSASDGTLRFLAMIAAMLGPDRAQLYFIEEIDTGIHPTRLHLLLQLIEQTVTRENVQVVATTHSPQLLGFLSDASREAATLVYRLPYHGEARLHRIMDIPEAREVLATRNLSRLHESGWLENAVTYLEAESIDEEAQA